MSEVNHVDGNVVSPQALAQVLALFERLRKRVTAESNDSLALLLVLPVLEGELGNFDCSEEVSVPVDVDLADGVDDLADVVGLS